MKHLGAAAAFSGFLGVLLSAFGTHALRDRLTPADLEIFQTGARFHLMHALAGVLAYALISRSAAKPVRLAMILFLVGTVLFSGSLYVLAVSGIRSLGMVAPLGGASLMAGWIALGIAISRGEQS